MTLVEKGFRTGWIRLSEGSSKKKKKRKAGVLHKLRHPIIAVGKKEWFSIKRDVREWLVVMPIAVMLIFGLIGFFSSGENLSDIRLFHEISWPIAQVILLFIYVFSSSMIAASSIGREGPSLWILQSLPLTGKQISLGKLWISWLLPFILLTCLEIIIGLVLGWTLGQFILGIIIKAIVTVGLSSLGIWLGTIGAKYHPTNPQQRLNFGVSIILFVSSWIYVVIAMIPTAYLLFPASLGELELSAEIEHGAPALFVMIANIVMTLLAWKISVPLLAWATGLLALLIISGGLSYLFIYLSARKIDKGLKIDLVSETSSKPLFGGKKSSGSLY